MAGGKGQKQAALGQQSIEPGAQDDRGMGQPLEGKAADDRGVGLGQAVELFAIELAKLQVGVGGDRLALAVALAVALAKLQHFQRQIGDVQRSLTELPHQALRQKPGAAANFQQGAIGQLGLIVSDVAQQLAGAILLQGCQTMVGGSRLSEPLGNLLL